MIAGSGSLRQHPPSPPCSPTLASVNVTVGMRPLHGSCTVSAPSSVWVQPGTRSFSRQTSSASKHSNLPQFFFPRASIPGFGAWHPGWSPAKKGTRPPSGDRRRCAQWDGAFLHSFSQSDVGVGGTKDPVRRLGRPAAASPAHFQSSMPGS